MKIGVIISSNDAETCRISYNGYDMFYLSTQRQAVFDEPALLTRRGSDSLRQLGTQDFVFNLHVLDLA